MIGIHYELFDIYTLQIKEVDINNSSTKPKFYKNTKLAGKIIEKTSLTNFY